jgi:2-hydroxychromene-2-carboxylate isomerase
MAGKPVVEFFYSVSFPSCYLALVRLREALLRTGAALVFRPIVTAWLPDDVVQAGACLTASSNPAVDAYLRKDTGDWSRFCGVQIDPQYCGPINSAWVQRGAVAAIDAGRIADYAEAAFRARFSEGRDISNRAVVVDIATRCGMTKSAFNSALDSGHTESIVRRNMAALVQRGGFGSPTMFLGDDMYFGHERVPLLEMALMRSAEQPFIAPGEHDR